MNCIVYKFADDLKLCRRIEKRDAVGCTASLQLDLEGLDDFCSYNLLFPNPAKCSVMHCGEGNPTAEYELSDVVLRDAVSEKDLGITITNNLKMSQHCAMIAQRAEKLI